MAEAENPTNTTEEKPQTQEAPNEVKQPETPSAEAPAAADTKETEKATPETPTVAEAKPEMKEEPVEKVELPPQVNTPNSQSLLNNSKLDLLNDLYVAITIEIGKAQIKIRDLLNLNKGSIIELNKLSGEPVDVYANGKLIASGNIITVNGKYCVRLISVTDAHKSNLENPHEDTATQSAKASSETKSEAKPESKAAEPQAEKPAATETKAEEGAQPAATEAKDKEPEPAKAEVKPETKPETEGKSEADKPGG